MHLVLREFWCTLNTSWVFSIIEILYLREYLYLYFVFELSKVFVFVFEYYSEYLTPNLVWRLHDCTCISGGYMTVHV